MKVVSGLLAGAIFSAHATASAQDLAPPAVGDPSAPNTANTTNPGAQPPPPQPEGAKLDTAEKKDSKRGLEWVYLNADAGFSYINMTGFSGSNLVTTNNAAAGPTFGVAAGIRLFILTLGVKASLNELSTFNLWQLDGEIGFHIPIGHWDPYLGLHGGYCFVGSLDDGLSGSTANLSITGGDAGLQVGVDYYFNHFVSLGLEGSGNALFLSRPAIAPAGLPPQAAMAYQASADSVGFGVVGSLHLGFHL
jgi:hypothetical protein